MVNMVRFEYSGNSSLLVLLDDRSHPLVAHSELLNNKLLQRYHVDYVEHALQIVEDEDAKLVGDTIMAVGSENVEHCFYNLSPLLSIDIRPEMNFIQVLVVWVRFTL